MSLHSVLPVCAGVPQGSDPPVCPPADSKAIVDGNLKLILGLIWTLILHYSISMPMWDEEDEEEAKRQTPKQRLLGWIQNRLPQLPITNFSKDWQSGRALGALVDSCAPGEGTWGPRGGPGGVRGHGEVALGCKGTRQGDPGAVRGHGRMALGV